MGETTERMMTLATFLDWDDGSDRRSELIDGEPVMRTPPRKWLRRILGNLGWLFGDRLPAPWQAELEGGIRLPHRGDRSFHVADVAITAAPAAGNDPRTEAPVVIIEILSPETRLYSSSLTEWRRHRAAGTLTTLAPANAPDYSFTISITPTPIQSEALKLLDVSL